MAQNIEFGMMFHVISLWLFLFPVCRWWGFVGISLWVYVDALSS